MNYFTQKIPKKSQFCLLLSGITYKGCNFYQEYARKIECLNRFKLHFKDNFVIDNYITADSLYLKQHKEPFATIYPESEAQLRKIVYYSEKFDIGLIIKDSDSKTNYEKVLEKPFLIINLKYMNNIKFIDFGENNKKYISVTAGATFSDLINFCDDNNLYLPHFDTNDTKSQIGKIITKNGFTYDGLSAYVKNQEILQPNRLTIQSIFVTKGELGSIILNEVENFGVLHEVWLNLPNKMEICKKKFVLDKKLYYTNKNIFETYLAEFSNRWRNDIVSELIVLDKDQNNVEFVLTTNIDYTPKKNQFEQDFQNLINNLHKNHIDVSIHIENVNQKINNDSNSLSYTLEMNNNFNPITNRFGSIDRFINLYSGFNESSDFQIKNATYNRKSNSVMITQGNKSPELQNQEIIDSKITAISNKNNFQVMSSNSDYFNRIKRFQKMQYCGGIAINNVREILKQNLDKQEIFSNEHY